jgi:hypothetical protein
VTDTLDPPVSWHDGARHLLADLTAICGTLSEIATVWRRARPHLPELPLVLPLQLQDAARQLAADIRPLAGDGPVQPPDRALPADDRFGSLQQSIAMARAMTCGPGIPQVGDARLWESLSALLCRARTQLAALTPHLVPAGA